MVRKIKRKNQFISPTLQRVSEGEYLIIFSDNADKHINKYYDAIKNLEEEQVTAASNLLKDVTNVLRGHFASYNVLIDIAQGRGDHSQVAKLFTKGEKEAKLILDSIGKEDTIPWKYGSNRDLLRFLYNLGVRSLNTFALEKAERIFKTLIKLNPSDDQDVKEILVDTLFDLNKYSEIIEVSRDYDHSKNSAMILNEILCHYILGDKGRAKELINELSSESVAIYRKLDTKESSPVNKFVPMSAIEDKSLFYWENFRGYWEFHKGALDFLKENIENLNIEEVITPAKASPSYSLRSLDDFRDSLVEKNLKESTIEDHIENIKVFGDNIGSKDRIFQVILDLYKESLTKSRLNKLITSLNQYFRFSIEDKDELKEILADFRTFKEGLINSMN